MKVTKTYLKQVIKEELQQMSEVNTLSPTKQKLLDILSKRVGRGMDAELLVHVLTDQEAELLLKQQTGSGM